MSALARKMLWVLLAVLGAVQKAVQFGATRTERKLIRLGSAAFDNSNPALQVPIPRGHVEGVTYYPPSPNLSRGIFSELTALLVDIARLGIALQRIDTTEVFLHNSSGRPIFEEMFHSPGSARATSHWLANSKDIHHSVYRELPWGDIRPLARKWFSLRPDVLNRARTVLGSHQIKTEEILAVSLRGSQKTKEIKPVPTRAWVDETRELLTRFPKLRVVVFSDDQDLVDDFLSNSDFPVIDFGQEVRTRRGNSINFEFRTHTNRDEFLKNFVSRTWIISQSAIVLTHTGNSALWSCIFRGCTCGVYQFTSQGRLALPYPGCDQHLTR